LVIDPGPDTPAAAPAPAAPAPAPAPAPAAAAAASGAASASASAPAEPTLHDFVLGLLQNPASMDAFNLDPQGCLNAAGLHDLVPGDVHDVIPLVTDLVPNGGLDSLQNVSSVLDIDSGASIDGGFAKVASSNPLGDFVGAGDVKADTDGVSAGVGTVNHSLLGDLTFGNRVVATTDGSFAVTNAFDGAAGYGVVGAAGSLGTDPSLVLDVEAGGHELHVGYDHGLVLDQDVVPVDLPNLGNPADLAKGLADPTAAASALAGAVPALPVAVPGLPGLPDLGHLPVDVPQLPALPALPTNEVANVTHTVTNEVTHVTQTVDTSTVTDSVSGVVGQAPAAPHLPVDLGHLPVDLPHLPVELPHLPVDVPHLPNLPVLGGGADGHGVVGDVVDKAGLGDVLNHNPASDAVHSIVPDLHLPL
jgi:hypothetical protein